MSTFIVNLIKYPFVRYEIYKSVINHYTDNCSYIKSLYEKKRSSCVPQIFPFNKHFPENFRLNVNETETF